MFVSSVEEREEEPALPFPRISAAAEAKPKPLAEGQVLLRIREHREKAENGFEVTTSKDGISEIPLAVFASTHAVRVQRSLLERSPWLNRCLDGEVGEAVRRSLRDEETEFQLDDEPGRRQNAVVARRCDALQLDIDLPSHGAGRLLLSPQGLLEALDLCAEGAEPLDPNTVPAVRFFALFACAAVLELGGIADLCRQTIRNAVDSTTVALALAVAYAFGDDVLLARCYWCLREHLYGATGPPPAWLDGRGPIRLVGGILSYKSVCKTPLRVLASVVEADFLAKQRWATATDGYTLCQVHRSRQEGGSYPHTYELRLDHTDETLLIAVREDEQSPVRMFAKSAVVLGASEHCEDYLGICSPNFWGTVFTLWDHGADVEALRRSPSGDALPLKPRRELCKIGFDTNILGDAPRKITVDFERDGSRHHLENIAPRWDKKLNSYALPFFGRVKKASAKNFQLVVDDNPNTIFLIFGKISKDVFCLDFRSPLSTLDAMAIACASMAKKRAVS